MAESGNPVPRPWTGAEERRLLEEYPAAGMHEMAARLGRTPRAILGRASKLGAVRKARWTGREDAIIRKAWEGPPHGAAKRAARRLPGRALHSINKRASTLGLAAPARWQPWEDAIVRQCAAKGLGAWQRAADRLPHRSLIAIGLRGNKLGIWISRRWTSEEDAIVRREWARGNRGAAKRVKARLRHRSLKAIAGRARLVCPEHAVPRGVAWSAEEDAILERAWAAGSRGAADRAVALLPHRTRGAVTGRARTLQLNPHAASVRTATPAFLRAGRSPTRRRRAPSLTPAAAPRREEAREQPVPAPGRRRNGVHRPSRAYQLALAGHSFEEIAGELGHEDARQAKMQTRNWAKANGITWPPARPQREAVVAGLEKRG